MEEPIAKFTAWFAEAGETKAIKEPTAMALASSDAGGTPSVRIVLLKSFDARGFVFYTNFESRKGRELLENPKAAAAFYWMPLDKQVRIEGTVSKVADAEADAYFASRERHKQAGAWASLQSEPMEDRDTLLHRVEAIEKKYEGEAIPRPPHWSGLRLAPERIEFWHQREARLHDREVFTRTGNSWSHTLLYP